MTNYTDNMNLNFTLTTTQKEKVNTILNQLANSMGHFKDNYELREIEVRRLYNETNKYYHLHKGDKTIVLSAYHAYKTHETNAFADSIYVFITARGKVSYCDHKHNHKIRTYTGSNIWTLICANN